MGAKVIVPVTAVVDRNGTMTGLPLLGAAPLACVKVIVSALPDAEADKPRLIGTS